jgi:hypothetical protein
LSSEDLAGVIIASVFMVTMTAFVLIALWIDSRK